MRWRCLDQSVHFELHKAQGQKVDAQPKKICNDAAIDGIVDQGRVTAFLAAAMGHRDQKSG